MCKTVPCPKQNTVFPTENLDSASIPKRKHRRSKCVEETENKMQGPEQQHSHDFLLSEMYFTELRVPFSEKDVLLFPNYIKRQSKGCSG